MISLEEAGLVEIDYSIPLSMLGEQLVYVLLKCRDWQLEDFQLIRKTFFEEDSDQYGSGKSNLKLTNQYGSKKSDKKLTAWHERVPCGSSPLTSEKTTAMIHIDHATPFLDSVFVDTVDYLLNFADLAEDMAKDETHGRMGTASVTSFGDFVDETLDLFIGPRSWSHPIGLLKEAVGAALRELFTVLREDKSTPDKTSTLQLYDQIGDGSKRRKL